MRFQSKVDAHTSPSRLQVGKAETRPGLDIAEVVEPSQPADLASPAPVDDFELDQLALPHPFGHRVDRLAVRAAVRMLEFPFG
jgi:hypothetical protein